VIRIGREGGREAGMEIAVIGIDRKGGKQAGRKIGRNLIIQIHFTVLESSHMYLRYQL
jgi:hypothetical protein